MAALIGIAQASPTRVSRAQLFSRGAKGGAAFLVAGSFAESLVGSAAAADTVPDSDLAHARLLAANEAEHLSGFTRLSGRSPIGIALPRPLTIDQASNAFDVFTS